MTKQGLATWHNRDEWKLTNSVAAGPSSSNARRSAKAGAQGLFPLGFLADNVSVAEVVGAAPTAARRAASVPLIDLSLPVVPGESYVVALRHASGALTFHTGELEMAARRGAAAEAKLELRFKIPLRVSPEVSLRRGLGAAAVTVIVLKVTGIVVDAILPSLVTAWEKRAWRQAGLAEGLVKVDAAGLSSGTLKPTKAQDGTSPSGRALLLIHGTFSNAAASFRGFAQSNFLANAAAVYGDRIYAFNHFTLSKTPAENAKDLRALLPAEMPHDVVTHSRGGLVLRNLVERPVASNGPARPLELNQAVLVASPNDGTPLATPARWKETVGWVANLIEQFPDTPWTFGASFVAEAIVWLASRAAGGIPGIAAMDRGGLQIEELQDSTTQPPSAYSALTANYSPDQQLLLKMLDVGIDIVLRQRQRSRGPDRRWLENWPRSGPRSGDPSGAYRVLWPRGKSHEARARII